MAAWSCEAFHASFRQFHTASFGNFTVFMSGLLLLAFAAVKRIAIIGGGLAGLGTAVSLLDSGACVVHVYDAEPTPGTGGASAVAAGLLHPFRPNGREIWLGRNGFEATSALVERCEKLIGARLSGREGLLRLALDADQAGDLQAAVSASAESHGPLDQTWWTREQVQAAHAGTAALGGAFAPSAMSLDTPAYLKALWKLCEAIGAETAEGEVRWRAKRLSSLAELHAAVAAAGEAPYDAVVVANGFGATELAELRGLALAKALRPCRGQNLILAQRPEAPDALRVPLINGDYVVPMDGGRRLLAGATHEYDPPERVNRPADETAACALLLPGLVAMHAPLATARIVGVQAGVRSLPPRSHLGYAPIAGRLPPLGAAAGPDAAHEGEATKSDATKSSKDATKSSKAATAAAPGAARAATWLFGGLGSRGLIYHAVLGARVAEAVMADDEGRLPEHMRRLDLRSALGAATLSESSSKVL